tara:strand:+ start:172 stop:1815 length:1644 start_codon:yes stop_codon:yes gene_type:complete
MRTAILAFAFPLVAFAYEGDDKLGTCSGEDTVVKNVCAVTEGVCHAWSSEPTGGATWPTSPSAGKVWPLDRGTWVSNLISVHGKTATTATKMYFTSPPLAGIDSCSSSFKGATKEIFDSAGKIKSVTLDLYQVFSTVGTSDVQTATATTPLVWSQTTSVAAGPANKYFEGPIATGRDTASPFNKAYLDTVAQEEIKTQGVDVDWGIRDSMVVSYEPMGQVPAAKVVENHLVYNTITKDNVVYNKVYFLQNQGLVPVPVDVTAVPLVAGDVKLTYALEVKTGFAFPSGDDFLVIKFKVGTSGGAWVTTGAVEQKDDITQHFDGYGRFTDVTFNAFGEEGSTSGAKSDINSTFAMSFSQEFRYGILDRTKTTGALESPTVGKAIVMAQPLGGTGARDFEVDVLIELSPALTAMLAATPAAKSFMILYDPDLSAITNGKKAEAGLSLAAKLVLAGILICCIVCAVLCCCVIPGICIGVGICMCVRCDKKKKMAATQAAKEKKRLQQEVQMRTMQMQQPVIVSAQPVVVQAQPVEVYAEPVVVQAQVVSMV